jgi:hypothetical protein
MPFAPQDIPGTPFPGAVLVHFFPGLKQGPSSPPTGGDKPSPAGGCGRERFPVGLIHSPFIERAFFGKGAFILELAADDGFALTRAVRARFVCKLQGGMTTRREK